MTRFFKAEVWDKTQFLFRHYYDRMMHAIFYYDGMLNVELAKKAYFGIINQIPVFRSSYMHNPIKPFWRLNKITPDDIFEFIETDNLESEIRKHLYNVIHHRSKAQIIVKLIRCQNKDIILILGNHMCMDGGDMKVFNASISALYNALLKDENAVLTIKSGDRSMNQVYDAMGGELGKRARKLYSNVSAIKTKNKFPYTKKSKSDTPRIIIDKMSAENFKELRSIAKKVGASVNDLFVTAYMRAIYKMCNLPSDAPLTIPCMMDLRRYLPKGESKGFTNLTGSMPCTIEGGIGNTFNDTLLKIKARMDAAKGYEFNGLSGTPLLKLAYGIFPNFISELAIRIGYGNALIGMSNIGAIDPSYLKMGDVSVTDIMFTGGIKKKPYIQLVLTTLENVVTLNVASICNDEDEKLIKQMLNMIKTELSGFLEENK